MHVSSVYTVHENSTEDYFIVLECGCQYRVSEAMILTGTEDFPCVLHEEERYLQVPPHLIPPPSDDPWADEPN